jgi:sugar/nucleoside kinase (ribokinase family)
MTNPVPLVVGTGLVALDVVVSENQSTTPSYWAGGTCGNVLTILRYLGWQSAPIARLRQGVTADSLLSDLKRWGVATDFITLAEDGSTPVIVQRIGQTATGEPYHTFSWRGPNCGARLPGYKPVLATEAEELVNRLDSPRVFFFDRLSRGALVIARACAERGAAVVFEPSSVGNIALFREAWEIANVVKYSHERLQELPPDVESMKGERLQIETLGREGLRYKARLSGCKNKTWQNLDALPTKRPKDTAGAGDWCTAGIVHKLMQGGVSSLRAINDVTLRDSIRYGQSLAAWTCGFEGARGGMYAVEKPEFERQVAAIQGVASVQKADRFRQRVQPQDILSSIYPCCERADGKSQASVGSLRTSR